MKTLKEIYSELMKEHKYVRTHDFLEYCYAYKNGKCKKFTSASEAQKFSNHVEYIFDGKRYKEALDKNDQIKHYAGQEIKRLMKDRLGVNSNDKLDNAFFELAFELGEREFDNECENFDSYSHDDKDHLFVLVGVYYEKITEYLPKEHLRLLLKD